MRGAARTGKDEPEGRLYHVQTVLQLRLCSAVGTKRINVRLLFTTNPNIVTFVHLQQDIAQRSDRVKFFVVQAFFCVLHESVFRKSLLCSLETGVPIHIHPRSVM